MKKIDETVPEKLEQMVLKKYPKILDDISKQKKLFQENGIIIPEYCVFPQGICGLVAVSSGGISLNRTYSQAAEIDMLSAVLTWRINKIVYRFDKTLAEEMMPSNTEAIKPPREIIEHCPYPCVYIQNLPELPDVDGAFFLLDYDVGRSNDIQINIVYCFKEGGVFSFYWQWYGSLCNGRDIYIPLEYSQAAKQNEAYGRKAGLCLERALQHLNMFLYLCSDEPDISRDAPLPRIKGSGIEKKASRTDIVNVGRYIGATLRKCVKCVSKMLHCYQCTEIS